MSDQITDFEPMEGGNPHSEGRPSLSTRDIARQAAAEAVRGDEDPYTRHAGRPGDRFEETRRPSNEPVEEVFEDNYEDDFVATPEPQPSHHRETYQRLAERGVDVPISPDDVPEEFQGAYAQLLQSLADTHESAYTQSQDARHAMERTKAFAERLSTPEGQRRLILTMNSRDPNALAEIMQTVERMNEDADYAEMIRRNLEADIKLEAATIKENAFKQTERTTKGQAIEGRTTRLAAAKGVDAELAKEMVIARIYQNQARTGTPDITLQEVDEIVGSLAQRMGTTPRPQAKQPTTQQREQQAPRRPEGAGRDPQPRRDEPETSRRNPVGTGTAMDRLRGAVRQASQNVRSKGL